MLAQLIERIKSARATGWVGPGLGSSSAAADSKMLTGLGIFGNDKPNGAPFYNSFGGVPTDANAILVRYTYNGDANLNGLIDGTDYSFVDNGYNFGLGGWRNGDFNYDGIVNGTDFTIVDNGFNFQGAPLAASPPVLQAVNAALLQIVPVASNSLAAGSVVALAVDQIVATDADGSVEAALLPPPPPVRAVEAIELSKSSADVDDELLDVLSSLN